MFKPLKHPNVKILEATEKALIGLTGVIVDKEDKLYRVQLDQPVTVAETVIITELFMPAVLKVLKTASKPVIATEPAPAPAVATIAAADLASTPDTRNLDTAIAILGGSKARKPRGRKDGKPKALSAKQFAQQAAGVKVTDEPTKPKGKGKKLFTGKPKVDRGAARRK